MPLTAVAVVVVVVVAAAAAAVVVVAVVVVVAAAVVVVAVVAVAAAVAVVVVVVVVAAVVAAAAACSGRCSAEAGRALLFPEPLVPRSYQASAACSPHDQTQCMCLPGTADFPLESAAKFARFELGPSGMRAYLQAVGRLG